MMAQVRKSQSTESKVLPDGTVHEKISLTSAHSTEDRKLGEVIETFERPPQLVQETMTIEEVLPDGTKRKRQVALNRMVQSCETRRESFDENNHTIVDQAAYNIEEVVPNTVSAFEAGPDSDYEEELQSRLLRGISIQKDSEYIEEILPDGRKVIKKIRLKRKVHHTRDRKESLDSRRGEEYPGNEVVPMTVSAFDADPDSETEIN